MTRQVLFVQGGGEGVHDQWDDKLVASLRRELGPGYEVRYPRMPGEDDPHYAPWKRDCRRSWRASTTVRCLSVILSAPPFSSTCFPNPPRHER